MLLEHCLRNVDVNAQLSTEALSFLPLWVVFCSLFLSLAECWRFAAVPFSFWKDLRALDRVAAELSSCKKARLSDVAVDTDVDS